MKIAAVVVLAGGVVMASAFSIRPPVIVYYDGPEATGMWTYSI